MPTRHRAPRNRRPPADPLSQQRPVFHLVFQIEAPHCLPSRLDRNRRLADRAKDSPNPHTRARWCTQKIGSRFSSANSASRHGGTRHTDERQKDRYHDVGVAALKCALDKAALKESGESVKTAVQNPLGSEIFGKMIGLRPECARSGPELRLCPDHLGTLRVPTRNLRRVGLLDTGPLDLQRRRQEAILGGPLVLHDAKES